ncbi:MAG: hypothetical protein ACO1O1_03220 [Adhaeribacter sp.]
MKFILSLIALALFFAFALVDAAKGITYATSETELVVNPGPQTPDTDLTIAKTPQQEKAGFSL